MGRSSSTITLGDFMKTILMIIGLFVLNDNVHAATSIKKSNIAFTAIGRPSFIKAKGNMALKSANITQNGEFISGEFVVDLNNLKSGIELRDQHLKEKYLEVNKYPLAKITFTQVELAKLSEIKKIQATLTLHGVTKPVILKADFKKEDTALKLDTDFTIDLSQHQIDIPSFQGITVAKDVKVKVESLINYTK